VGYRGGLLRVKFLQREAVLSRWIIYGLSMQIDDTVSTIRLSLPRVSCFVPTSPEAFARGP
jgi:hypothetical protein